MVIVRLQNVSKRFWVSHEKPALVRELLPRLIRPPHIEHHWALRDINLELDRGESLGIIGPNGSGKTTLLSVIAGITEPTTGTVSVDGNVATLLTLGSGFHPQLTGLENIFLNGTLLGMGTRQIRRKLEAIVAFSQLDGFIDAPLATYSAGMQLRLGFAIAIHTEADILLIDECLAVGDLAFQRKCLTHLEQLKDGGKTLVLVSQSLEPVERLCTRTILLERGRLIADGSPQQVGLIYQARSLNQVAGQELESGGREEEGSRATPAITVRPEWPGVSFSIVNFNGVRWLPGCLASIQQLDYPPDSKEVFVVDNGSTDGSVELLQQQFPWVQLIRNPKNNTCAAQNLAIAASSGTFIALMDNDVELDPGWLKPLVELMVANPRIGAAMGTLLFMDRVTIQGTGTLEYPDFRWGYRGIGQPDSTRCDQIEELSYAPGTAILFRRACLDDIGPLDEDFHGYHEDIDFSLRCRRRGWKLYYVARGRAFHAHHGTFSEAEAQTLDQRNRLLIVAKHFPDRLSDILCRFVMHHLFDSSLISMVSEVLQKLIREHPPERIASVVQITSVVEEILQKLNQVIEQEGRWSYHADAREVIGKLQALVSSVEPIVGVFRASRERLHIPAEEVSQAVTSLTSLGPSTQTDDR